VRTANIAFQVEYDFLAKVVNTWDHYFEILHFARMLLEPKFAQKTLPTAYCGCLTRCYLIFCRHSSDTDNQHCCEPYVAVTFYSVIPVPTCQQVGDFRCSNVYNDLLSNVGQLANQVKLEYLWRGHRL